MTNIQKAIQAFNLPVELIEEVKESFSSTVRILKLSDGKNVVLKIPFNREKLKREAQVLSQLADNSLIPNLLEVWYGDAEHVGAILMSYIEGEPINLPVKESVIFDIGRALATLHSIECDRFEINDIDNDWWASLEKRLDLWIEEIGDCIPIEYKTSIKTHKDQYMQNKHKADGPCLVHFDYRPGNILIKDDKLVGVIDFESSRGGSADIDFTKISDQLWSLYPGSKELFLKGYQSVRPVPDYEQNLAMYRVHNAIGGIAWCVRRNILEDPFYYENLDTLKQIFKL